MRDFCKDYGIKKEPDMEMLASFMYVLGCKFELVVEDVPLVEEPADEIS